MATTANTFANPTGFDYRPYAITGMAFGALIMGFFGGIWLALGLAAAQVTTAFLGLLVVLFLASLVLPGWKMLRIGRSAIRLAGPLSPQQQRERQRINRNFGIIFTAEGLLIFLAVNVLNNLHLELYVVPAIAAIVGLHFLPLARLYGVPMYYVVGTVMTLAALGSLAIPSSLRASSLGVAMGVIIWITCTLVIRRGFQLAESMKKTRN